MNVGFKDGVRYFVLPNYQELDPDYQPRRSRPMPTAGAYEARAIRVLALLEQYPQGLRSAELASLLGWGKDTLRVVLDRLIEQRRARRRMTTVRPPREGYRGRLTQFIYLKAK